MDGVFIAIVVGLIEFFKSVIGGKGILLKHISINKLFLVSPYDLDFIAFRLS